MKTSLHPNFHAYDYGSVHKLPINRLVFDKIGRLGFLFLATHNKALGYLLNFDQCKINTIRTILFPPQKECMIKYIC